MERATVKGRFDRTAETQAIKLVLLANGGDSGPTRRRAHNTWDTVAEVEGDIVDWFSENLPDNDPVEP